MIKFDPLMKCRVLVVYTVIACSLVGSLLANSLAMRRTPVVSASLATGATYEVERSVSGGWTRTGVLVTGTGSAQSLRLDGFPADDTYRFSRVGTAEIVTAPKT